mgnify:CR=1 FL=1|jgi:uncharacterized protein YbjT (DUF2867 family)
MNFKQVTLFGSTGLIGSKLLGDLLKDTDYHLVNVITRTPFYLKHDKINNIVIDFNDYKSILDSVENSKAVFVSIGTTMAKEKGNKFNYKKVDYDITCNIAKACKEHNIAKFIYVSSLGADSNKSNFYLNLKGKIEDSVEELKLTSTVVFRPSVLIGSRSEFRFGEKIAQLLMSCFKFIIPEKSKPIEAEYVAKAMLNISKKDTQGLQIYHYKEIMNMN